MIVVLSTFSASLVLAAPLPPLSTRTSAVHLPAVLSRLLLSACAAPVSPCVRDGPRLRALVR